MMKAAERVLGSNWVPPWILHQHLTRYEWASTMVAGKRVVDAACGSGYGSNLLIKGNAASVEGIDICQETIAQASKEYQADNLRFQQGSVCDLPLESESADIFVSFETIEHIPDDVQFVREVHRVLRPGGTFLCSTPNRDVTNPGTTLQDKPYNPFHLREYDQDDLLKVLSTKFGRVHWMGQSFFSKSWKNRITNIAGFSRKMAVRTHQMRKVLQAPWQNRMSHSPQDTTGKTAPEFYIAVCTK